MLLDCVNFIRTKNGTLPTVRIKCLSTDKTRIWNWSKGVLNLSQSSFSPTLGKGTCSNLGEAQSRRPSRADTLKVGTWLQGAGVPGGAWYSEASCNLWICGLYTRQKAREACFTCSSSRIKPLYSSSSLNPEWWSESLTCLSKAKQSHLKEMFVSAPH